MKIPLLIVVSLLLAGGTGWFWYCRRHQEERLICRQLVKLTDLVGKSPGVSPAVQVLKSADIDRLFAPEIQVDSDPRPVVHERFTDRSLGKLLLAWQQRQESVRMQLDIAVITVHGDTAEVSGTMALTGADLEQWREVRRVQFTFRKLDGTWKISALTAVPPVMR